MSTKLEKWAEASAKLKLYKEQEAKLRREICNEVFNGKIGEFTTKGEYEGTPIKAKSVLNRVIDKASLGAIWEELSDVEKEAIKLEPKLVMSAYRKIPEDSLFHQAIIVKPGMPQLEIIE